MTNRKETLGLTTACSSSASLLLLGLPDITSTGFLFPSAETISSLGLWSDSFVFKFEFPLCFIQCLCLLITHKFFSTLNLIVHTLLYPSFIASFGYFWDTIDSSPLPCVSGDMDWRWWSHSTGKMNTVPVNVSTLSLTCSSAGWFFSTSKIFPEHVTISCL